MAGENDNVEIIEKSYELLNTRRIAEMMQYVSPRSVRHDLVGAYPGVGGAAVSDFLGQLLQGAPDLQGEIQDIFGADNKVCARVVLSGTHEGQLFGKPGSGKRFAVNMINIYRLEDGKTAESWQLVDLAGFLEQIGG